MKIRGKEVKVIQEYTDFILVEFPAGYRECISRFELGQISETERKYRGKYREKYNKEDTNE